MSYDANRSFSPTGSHNGRNDTNSQYMNPRPARPGTQLNEPKSSGVNGPPTSNPEPQTASTNRAAPTPYNQVRQPINDAVTSAFDGTNNAISPDLINQITQNVIQQLQSQGLPSPQMQHQYSTTSVPDQTDALSSSAASPQFEREQVYTPPSPHRIGEELPQTQTSGNISPKNLTKPTTSRQRDISPYSQGSYVGFHPDTTEDSTPRPLAPQRSLSDEGATVLEKIWGRLFDEQGHSLPRLAQFLRGIAIHLVEDYEPKGTLVVTPTKIQQFYKDTKLKDNVEIYPWEVIFDDHTSSISRMFRELSVQHHLVQERADTRPDIPGLTPEGFATWFTLVLQAHPEQEFERLAITARDMPISNPDEKKERFPKELPRRLFPTKNDEAVARRLQRLMAQHCNVNIPSRQNSTAENDQQRVRASSKPADRPTQSSSKVSNSSDKKEPPTIPVEKRDQPGPDFVLPARRRSTKLDDKQQSILRQQLEAEISAANSETTIEEDTSEVTTPQPPRPIERERKPYVAQPGGGKNYDVKVSSSSDERNEADLPPAEPQLRRANSISGAGRPSRGATVSLHQRSNITSDMPDLSKSRSATVHASDHDTSFPTNTMRDRARSNAGYPSSDTDTRLPRNNGIYQRDNPTASKSNTRVRSPSRPKFADDDLRSSATDVSYGSYQSTSSYVPDSFRTSERYDYRPAGHDSRDTRYEREPRPRYRNAGNGSDVYNSATEDYFRGSRENRENNVHYPAPNGTGQGHAQFPPNAYRDAR